MKIRWQVIIAVMLISVLLFFVISLVLAKFKVEKPLADLLENHSEVMGFEIQESKELMTIYITLNQTDRPIQFHKEIQATIETIINKDFIVTYYNEKPEEGSKEWEKYWRVSAIIAETINTNSYTNTIKSLEQIIGPDNFYFLVEDKKLYFSYKIEDRNFFSVYNLERGA